MEEWHLPGAGLEHLAGRHGVVRLVRLEQRDRADPDEEEGDGEGDEEDDLRPRGGSSVSVGGRARSHRGARLGVGAIVLIRALIIAAPGG